MLSVIRLVPAFFLGVLAQRTLEPHVGGWRALAMISVVSLFIVLGVIGWRSLGGEERR